MLTLTTPQTNILNLQRFYEGTSIANVCGAYLFPEKCDHILLNQAVNVLLRQQAGLRLRFTSQSGNVFQYEADYHFEQFPIYQFQNAADFEIFANQQARIPFELFDTPQYRFFLIDVGDQSGVLLSISHLIADAWAVSIVGRTINHYYHAIKNNTAIPEECHTYRTFIDGESKYYSSVRFEKDKEYWQSQFPVKPENCPIKPGVMASTNPVSRRYTTRVPATFAAVINRFSEDMGISQAVLFESALIAYLHTINPENHSVSIGMLTLNRNTPAERAAIGNCVSTLPLTLDISSVNTGEDLFEAVRTQNFKLFRHQRYPYSRILRELHDCYKFSGNVYDVLFSFQNAHTGVEGSTVWFPNGYCEVPLEFHVDNRDDTDSFTLNLDYQIELFPYENEIALLCDRILHVLAQLMACPSQTLDQLSILPEEEYHLVTTCFNQTARDFDKEHCVHELFAQQVVKTPDKTALVFEKQYFSFRQLDDMSNSLAHFLRKKGVTPGMIIPIASKRSWHFVVAMLGILKAGAAYMHIDIAYPEDRVNYMLQKVESNLCLTYGYSAPNSIETVSLEDFDYFSCCTPLRNLNQPGDLCYVIFTSGSTGLPKGLMISHRNVANFAAQNDLNVVGKIITHPNQNILAISSTSFDMSVTETLLPLVSGITIYLANDKQTLSQAELASFFADGDIHIMETTPTKMRIYLADRSNLQYLQSIDAFILGGESLPLDLYQYLRQITSAKIFNNYGPAETTVWSTIKEMTDDTITVGKPIANTQIYVLDKYQKPCPIGIPGEICIAGEGVGMGYLSQPELTSERFISSSVNPRSTMYRTGDLGAWRADGELFHLGRIDTQVKIRGLRIELGEIESVMGTFPGIELVAVVDQRDAAGRQYLVGYYTSSSVIDDRMLRQHLASKLPQYMVPNFLMRLPTLPLTSSGKTDRRALPIPAFTPAETTEYCPPQNEQERCLCEILEEMLSIKRVGVMDNFFELGGDSLYAIEYVTRAHDKRVEFQLQNVFDYPTVHALCEFINSEHNVHDGYQKESFEKYESLLSYNQINDAFVPVYHSLGNVLLTGATGFLGIHVLEQLVRSEHGRIYCLVRGGEKRLREALHYYFNDTYADLIGSRIFVINGDLSDKCLLNQLPGNVQTVIHTAASVKHYGPYAYFEAINVNGTKRMVEFAMRHHAKLLHISTISVSGNSLVDSYDLVHTTESIEFTERDIYVGQPLENVYVRSKFEAELVVFNAMLDGLDAKIIRVGNLSNRTSDFLFQQNYQSNAYVNRIKAVLELGCLPDYMLPLYAEFSPVDQTAEGVMKIGQYAQKQTVFHLNSDQTLPLTSLVDILRSLHLPMEILPGSQFNYLLQKAAGSTEQKHIYEALQNDVDNDGKLNLESNIHIQNAFTNWFMKQTGFFWCPIDTDYIRGYIHYFQSIGHFPSNNAL